MKMKILMLLFFVAFYGKNYSQTIYQIRSGCNSLCDYTKVKKSDFLVFKEIDLLIDKGPQFIKNNINKSTITIDTLSKSVTIRIEGYIPSKNTVGNLCEYDIIYDFSLGKEIGNDFEVTFTMQHEKDLLESYYSFNCGKYFNDKYDDDLFASNGLIECDIRRFTCSELSQNNFENRIIDWIKNVSQKKDINILYNL